MNLAFTPVTRRAFRANYYSPDVCQPGVISSGSSSSGSSGSISSVLDFTNEPQAGPVLSLSFFGEDSFLLTWTEVPEAVYYNVYRSTSSEGPFERIVEGVAATSYADIPEGGGPFYYYVTALEPSYGETTPSNIVTGSFEAPTGPGGVHTPVTWLAPESARFSDVGGTIASVVAGPIRFWQDLSDSANSAVYDPSGGDPFASTPPTYASDLVNGLKNIHFGNAFERTGLRTQNVVDFQNRMVTIFVVFRQLGYGFGEDAGIVWDYGNQLLLRQQISHVDKLGVLHNGAIEAPSGLVTVPHGVWTSLTYRFNPGWSRGEIYVNGVASPHTVDLSPTVGTFRLSIAHGYLDALAHHFGGDIAELIVFTRDVSDAEVTQVNNYLNSKYAL